MAASYNKFGCFGSEPEVAWHHNWFTGTRFRSACLNVGLVEMLDIWLGRGIYKALPHQVVERSLLAAPDDMGREYRVPVLQKAGVSKGSCGAMRHCSEVRK